MVEKVESAWKQPINKLLKRNNIQKAQAIKQNKKAQTKEK